MDVLTLIKHSLAADDVNPITKHFRIGKQVASAGPEMAWKIYQAIGIEDGKEASVFVFEKKIAEKLHKPRRREMVTEILRKDARFLSRLKHRKILRVLHPLEECHDSIAFATEPVFASLANLLGNYERLPALVPPEIKEHSFLDIEIKYGILQIAEALSYIHATERMLHMNVCPHSVLITKRGMWKLAGFGFSECSKDGTMKDAFVMSPCTSKHPKMAQPDLDYIAPEIQLETQKYATTSSDIFSLGMLICAIYNNGQSLIQAAHNTATYSKQIERMTELFGELAHKLPLQLVEPTEKMINKDIRYRPTAQLFMLLKYFDDNVVRCIQSLDSIDFSRGELNSPQHMELFNRLNQVIPQCPRKLLHNSVLPLLREQFDKPEMLVAVLPSMMTLIEHSTIEDYRLYIQPDFRRVFTMPARPVQATVYLLERINVILTKASDDDIRTDVLPMIFATIESNSIPGQEAAINVFDTIRKYVDDQTMRKLVLPKAKALFLKSTNVRTRLNALECIDRLIDSLDKMMILDEVLPFLTEIQCSDVDIIMSVISIYRHLLSDRIFGLTHSLLATKVMPTLIPYSVCPGLSIDQFSDLMEVLYEMLTQIDVQRRNKMISEAPDIKALELRRTSMDMRYSALEQGRPSRMDSSYGGSTVAARGGSHSQLSVDEPAGGHKMRTLSTPGTSRELYTSSSVTASSNQSLSQLQTPAGYRRHSSFQGLLMQESLDKGTTRIRKDSVVNQPYSLSPGMASFAPHILVSEASVTDFKELLSSVSPRRASSQSMGAVIDPIRRNSRELLDKVPLTVRRPSFQGICESAVRNNYI